MSGPGATTTSSVVNRNVCFQSEAKFAFMADMWREAYFREGQHLALRGR